MGGDYLAMLQKPVVRLLFVVIIFFAATIFSSMVFSQFDFGTDANAPTGNNEKKTADGKIVSGKIVDGGPKRGNSQRQIWRAGIVIEPGSQIEEAKVIIPVPKDWFEQEVLKINEEKLDAALSANIQYKTLNNGGAKEMILTLGRMRPHRKVEVIVNFELLNYELLPPENPDDYVIPKRPPRGLESYLKESPTIECNKSQFAKMFNEITKDKISDWDKIESLYAFVQNNVQYDEAGKNQPAKGAWAVINMPEGTWSGDCKDMSCLFVALCRAGKIPARIVRLPEHCYAEFYLELKPELNTSNSQGNETKKAAVPVPQGFWFPCQVAGSYSFGGIPERQPILQKGDSFPDPNKTPKGKTLFLKESFEGSLMPGSPPPKFHWIHEVKVK
ncbi:MAG: transglutaminase-like domain-containing protein [Planctomycetaceae bacterium]|nr:transglutaminase-like domain-containing protein [Planctomycetaceae bacterium]